MWTMLGVLGKYYEGWTPEVLERLTPRQARGWYNSIPKIEKMFTGEESGAKDKSHDMNDILDEADYLGIPTPPRE